MQALPIDKAKQFLLEAVQELFSKRHVPVPGALVKPVLSDRASEEGCTFDTRTLGFRSFLEFVRSIPELSVQTRFGSDFLVAPADSKGLLPPFATESPRIKPEFWNAFLKFPNDGTDRIYDPSAGRVLYVSTGTNTGAPRIVPPTKEEQLAWRREFAKEQPEPTRSELVRVLDSDSPFNNFTKLLRTDRKLQGAWNRVLQKRIVDLVKQWALENNVPDDTWRAGAAQDIGWGSLQCSITRSDVYRALDSLTLDQLLELKVPLRIILNFPKQQ